MDNNSSENNKRLLERKITTLERALILENRPEERLRLEEELKIFRMLSSNQSPLQIKPKKSIFWVALILLFAILISLLLFCYFDKYSYHATAEPALATGAGTSGGK